MVTFGPVGVTYSAQPTDDHDLGIAFAHEAESLGYSTLWLPGGQGNTLPAIDAVVRGTERIQVASGIIPVDVVPAPEVAQLYAELEQAAPGRFAVGLGGAHGPRPLRTLGAYLDRLDSEEPVVPAASRILAALGPGMLNLARERAAGAYPYLVTPEYVAGVRATLGPDKALAVLLAVVPGADADTAREIARQPLRFLTTVPGYRNNFLRMGFSESELASLADRLVDAVVAWGDLDTIVARVGEYHAAGADQVVLGNLGDWNGPGGWLGRFAEALLS
ncbi:TIGR03620 family F420-dependent LLM class oxidoreductase [Frankia sp. AgB32]|uniref:TIGR03620 family F420-dependent LLM class oxidoreductase n=1 Tax=Frankia sp. AgB32 TaxID=631119 RepID=UPI00200D8BF1|nr:TIGR03620 family F420-dependent LLM class oxidoreductase [Frankia sp. AgB32]MCK9896805.1 TIGR03620 family F420-dependent LLM class oxidoreductase [Frankia sp. AgB32]